VGEVSVSLSCRGGVDELSLFSDPWGESEGRQAGGDENPKRPMVVRERTSCAQSSTSPARNASDGPTPQLRSSRPSPASCVFDGWLDGCFSLYPSS
jgi:hypothetical protein